MSEDAQKLLLKLDAIAARLATAEAALLLYANETNWRPVFEQGGQEMRYWVGRGDGPAAARQVLEGAQDAK